MLSEERQWKLDYSIQRPRQAIDDPQLVGYLVLPEQETQLPIHTGTNLIGSCQDLVDIFVKGIGVSSMHAVIEVSPDGNEYFIEDLNSTNGTFIGKFKLNERTLYQISSGKEIIFGPTLTRLELIKDQKVSHDFTNNGSETQSSDSLVRAAAESLNVFTNPITEEPKELRENDQDRVSNIDNASSNLEKTFTLDMMKFDTVDAQKPVEKEVVEASDSTKQNDAATARNNSSYDSFENLPEAIPEEKAILKDIQKLSDSDSEKVHKKKTNVQKSRKKSIHKADSFDEEEEPDRVTVKVKSKKKGKAKVEKGEEFEKDSYPNDVFEFPEKSKKTPRKKAKPQKRTKSKSENGSTRESETPAVKEKLNDPAETPNPSARITTEGAETPNPSARITTNEAETPAVKETLNHPAETPNPSARITTEEAEIPAVKEKLNHPAETPNLSARKTTEEVETPAVKETLNRPADSVNSRRGRTPKTPKMTAAEEYFKKMDQIEASGGIPEISSVKRKKKTPGTSIKKPIQSTDDLLVVDKESVSKDAIGKGIGSSKSKRAPKESADIAEADSTDADELTVSPRKAASTKDGSTLGSTTRPSKPSSTASTKKSEAIETSSPKRKSQTPTVKNKRRKSETKSRKKRDPVLENPYRIMFTGLKSPEHEKLSKIIVKLGAIEVLDWDLCTHLVTNRILRTVKFLCCLAQGKHIMGLDWLEDSIRQGAFAEEKGFVLKDKASESSYHMDLGKSLQKARVYSSGSVKGKENKEEIDGNAGIRQILNGKLVNEKPLFDSISFYATIGVKPEPEHLREIVEAAGGTLLFIKPTEYKKSENVYIIGHENDLRECRALKKLGFNVYTNEIVLSSILRQELVFDEVDFL